MKCWKIILVVIIFLVSLTSCGTTAATIDPAAIANECIENDYLKEMTVDEIMTTLCGEYKTATVEGTDGYWYVTFAGSALEGFSVDKGSPVTLRVQCTIFDDASIDCKLVEATYGDDTAADSASALIVYNHLCMDISGEQVENESDENLLKDTESNIETEAISDTENVIQENEYYYLGSLGADLYYYGYTITENGEYVKDEVFPSYLILYQDGTYDLQLPFSNASPAHGKWYYNDTKATMDSSAIDLYDRNNRLLISGSFWGEGAYLDAGDGYGYEFSSEVY